MRLIDADELLGLFIESGQKHGCEHGCKLGEKWLLDYNDIKAVIDNAPTVGIEYEASNYSEGWMDGYNHAIDQIFKELNYLLKNHVIEELRKRIKR